eukprot:g5120.t1
MADLEKRLAEVQRELQAERKTCAAARERAEAAEQRQSREAGAAADHEEEGQRKIAALKESVAKDAAQLESLQGQLVASRGESDGLREQLAESTARAEAAGKRADALDVLLGEEREAHGALQKRVSDELEPELCQLREQLAAAARARDEEGARAERAEARAQEKAEALAGCELDLEELVKKHARLKLEQARVVKQLRETSKKAAHVSEREQQLREAMSAKDEVSRERDALDEQLHAALERELEARMLDYKSQREASKSFVVGSSFGPTPSAASPGRGMGGSIGARSKRQGKSGRPRRRI